MGCEAEPNVITVVLVEDQALVRDALTRLLNFEPDLHVVGAAADGRAGQALIRAAEPDVALLDVELPGMDGLQLAEAVRRDSPRTAVAMLTTFGRPGYVERALAAGARGFLLKEQPVAQLAANIRRLQAGAMVVDEELAVAALTSGSNPLTAREREILRRVGRGESVAAMAAALHLSAGTVRNYLSAAMQKLSAPTRWAAVHRAQEHGWL